MASKRLRVLVDEDGEMYKHFNGKPEKMREALLSYIAFERGYTEWLKEFNKHNKAPSK